MERAFAPRDRVSERERFYIEVRYHGTVSGNLEKGAELLKVLARIYPRHDLVHNYLGLLYSALGRYDRAAEEHREEIRLLPSSYFGYRTLADVYCRQDRLAEARETIRTALARKLDHVNLHMGLLWIAVLEGDHGTITRETAWVREHDPGELAFIEATVAIAQGRLRESRRLRRQDVDVNLQRGLKQAAAFSSWLCGRTPTPTCRCCSRQRRSTRIRPLQAGPPGAKPPPTRAPVRVPVRPP